MYKSLTEGTGALSNILDFRLFDIFQLLKLLKSVLIAILIFHINIGQCNL